MATGQPSRSAVATTVSRAASSCWKPSDDRRARLDDAGLFRGDQLDPVAEIGLVVQRDRHDQADGGFLDHIGGVEPAAKAHLDNGRVGRLFGKQQEHDRRQDFEHGDRPTVIGRRHPADGIDKGRIVDQFPWCALVSDPVALVPVHQVRRRVHMRA